MVNFMCACCATKSVLVASSQASLSWIMPSSPPAPICVSSTHPTLSTGDFMLELFRGEGKAEEPLPYLQAYLQIRKCRGKLPFSFLFPFLLPWASLPLVAPLPTVKLPSEVDLCSLRAQGRRKRERKEQ